MVSISTVEPLWGSLVTVIKSVRSFDLFQIVLKLKDALGQLARDVHHKGIAGLLSPIMIQVTIAKQAMLVHILTIEFANFYKPVSATEAPSCTCQRLGNRAKI